MRLKKVLTPRISGVSHGVGAKFDKGLAELRSIVTVNDVLAALSRGVAISIDGFRKRHGIGNSSLQNVEYKDGLESLREEKARIEKLLSIGGKRLVRGKLQSSTKPKGRAAAPRRSAERRQAEKAAVLLEARDADLEKALRTINALQREVSSLQAQLAPHRSGR
ncbi:hypothetical protein ACC708_25330 [Rhizobium ruizarguesonis]